MINEMLTGAIALASAIAGLFFLRFWKSSGDRLFFFFAVSFFLEGLNRVALGLTSLHDEHKPLFYLVRLLAYGLILFAIVDKNRRHEKTRAPASTRQADQTVSL